MSYRFRNDQHNPAVSTTLDLLKRASEALDRVQDDPRFEPNTVSALRQDIQTVRVNIAHMEAQGIDRARKGLV